MHPGSFLRRQNIHDNCANQSDEQKNPASLRSTDQQFVMELFLYKPLIAFYPGQKRAQQKRRGEISTQSAERLNKPTFH
jgi:hypothetical protein